jgi:hypothetical protein
MKLIFRISLLLLTCQTFGQNIILPDGEYMDTTSVQDTTCKNYNVYYYQVGGKYPENSSSILNELTTFLQTGKETYQGNGYITFRFRVDCQGKVMKQVQVLQTDEKYKSYHFDKGFVNELFSFFKTLNKWKIGMQPQNKPISYIAFITFKIENGKVVNIIP